MIGYEVYTVQSTSEVILNVLVDYTTLNEMCGHNIAGLLQLQDALFFTDHLNLIMHLGTKINQSEMSALRLQPNSNVSANSPAGDETIF